MNTLNHYLTPRVKRYAIVLGTAIILVALIFATSKRQNPDITQTPQQNTSSVDFTGIPPKELTLNRISADLERIHQQQKALHEEHQQEMERLQQEIRQLNPQDQPIQHQISVAQPPEPEPVPDVLQWNEYHRPPTTNYSEPYDYDAPPQPPKPIRVLGAIPPAVSPETKPKDQPKLLRLPAGSLLSGQLITGLDVPTGQGVRREPYPVLIRIKASAILPNRYRTHVRECFVLASGYGDLSSERAYLRSETLSCIFKHNQIRSR